MATAASIPPSVTTNAATNVTLTSATLNGVVNNSGQDFAAGAYVTATLTGCGFYWATHPNPTSADNVITLPTALGAMSATLTGLEPNTTYYFNAWASNDGPSTGTGTQLHFGQFLPIQSIKKTYLYKVYNNGAYLGNLPYVLSEFAVSQDINTAGSQITVECGISIDTAALPGSGPLTDETGATITDENGNAILTDGSNALVGIGSSNTLIRNGNKVKVWEYGYYAVNGRQVFSGTIENWAAEFGGSGDEKVTILIYSDGQDLDQHILTGPPYAYTTDQSQTSQNTAYTLQESASGGGYVRAGQSFTTGSSVSNLGAVVLLLNGAATVTVTIYQNSALGTVLASSSVNVNTGGNNQTTTFGFSVALKITASTSYFFTVNVESGQSISLLYQNTDVYAGGTMYEATYGGGSGGGAYGSVAYDLYFQTASSSGNTTATYTNSDPSTGMLEAVMNDYIQKGGIISYTSKTIQATGLSLTAGFNTNTVLEGITSFLSFAPNGFYWYVDLGSNLLYFKQANTVADLKLTKGVHLDSIKIVASIEQVKNNILFTGGATTSGGTNLFKAYQDTTSVSQYGVRLDRKSDNRVTVDATADAIGNSALAIEKLEQYQTVVTIQDKTMDIGSVRVGMVVGFNGFGTFVDNLLAQIVRIDYTPDEATLSLGILPKRNLPAFEKITRGLIALQTVANPTAPS